MADECACGTADVTFAVFSVGVGGISLVRDPAGKFCVRDGIARPWRKGDGERFTTHWCRPKGKAEK